MKEQLRHLQKQRQLDEEQEGHRLYTCIRKNCIQKSSASRRPQISRNASSSRQKSSASGIYSDKLKTSDNASRIRHYQRQCEPHQTEDQRQCEPHQTEGQRQRELQRQTEDQRQCEPHQTEEQRATATN